MKIKKYIKYNIFIMAILIVVLLYLSNYYNKNLDNGIKKFKIYEKLNEKSVSIVNVGSSHGMLGIISNSNNIMNLANSAQNYYYDLKLLKKYSDKIEEDAIVIIPVSIFSFYNREQNTIDKNYIKILEFKDIKNISKKDYLLEKYLSAVFPINNLGRILQSSFLVSKKEVEIISEEERKKGVSKIVNYHLGINGSKIYSIKNSEEDFKELLLYIKSKAWTPILITTPFTYIYNDEIERVYKEAYDERIYKNIEIATKELGDILYLDYSQDERFINNLDYFSDSDHLNKRGAEYFTQILLSDIKNKVGER